MGLLCELVEDLLKLCILGVVFVDVEVGDEEEADQFLGVVGATSAEDEQTVAVPVLGERGAVQQAARPADNVIHVLGNQQEGFSEVTGRLALWLVVTSLVW